MYPDIILEQNNLLLQEISVSISLVKHLKIQNFNYCEISKILSVPCTQF